jgi:Cu2+-containing amine oxidase
MVFSSLFPRSTILLPLSIAVLCLATAATSGFQDKPYQPLDPLTPQEMETAAQVASADQRVKSTLAGGRQKLIRVQFLALKPAKSVADDERIQIGRHAEVLFYRYEGDEGVHVIVDLEKKAVIAVKKIEGRAVPLSSAEVNDAFQLAARNERVRALVGARMNLFKVANLEAGERPEDRVEGLRVVATSRRDPCYRHRCVDLLFHTSEGYLAGIAVTVDLTAQTVRAERTIK